MQAGRPYSVAMPTSPLPSLAQRPARASYDAGSEVASMAAITAAHTRGLEL